MFRSLFSTAYIILIEGDFGAHIVVYSTKGKKVLRRYERFFEAAKSAKRFLEQIISSHYFCYVASYFQSIGQGILPSKDQRDLVKFGLEQSNIGLIRIGDFYLYASKREIASALSCCSQLLSNDLLYSPFNILHVLQEKARSKNCSLYLLKYKNLVAVAVYKNGVAKFGNYFALKVSLSTPEDIQPSALDGLGFDDAQDFEELTFDTLDDMEEISDIDGAAHAIIDEEASFDGSLANFDTEMAIFDYLKTAIREFYENNIYESDFIDQLHIFEHEASSAAFLTMIKTELYLNPIAHKIDIFYELFSLVCKDLGVSFDS